ncbi:Glycoside hydrolase family 125 protein [Mycena sanguinolenta]|uniref:Glycoside hydrolase family 125 protein n=1 Tax=Mycena sanguinolenta TaxID=230812 RepID=A0A8H7DIN2_9AGAR|nr:Glycoside hydrolase family 125 protein [Mycena sanguinolenta]
MWKILLHLAALGVAKWSINARAENIDPRGSLRSSQVSFHDKSSASDFEIPATGMQLPLSAVPQCPDYTTYAQTPQGNPSSGPLALPYIRPDPACRTFNSTAVEKVITDMKARLKDPDLARLFENTFPNTLDTTVKYFNATENLAFIITGDITAQWLRDTSNQFAAYIPLLPSDPALSALVKAVINNEARYVMEYPYSSFLPSSLPLSPFSILNILTPFSKSPPVRGIPLINKFNAGGAFQPPPESGLAPSHNDWADGVTVNPPVNNRTVFECKYELDSLCGFLKLSRTYYGATKDASFMNDNWYSAISAIFRVIDEQSQASFDDDFNWVSYYNWTGGNRALSPKVPNGGNGEPKGYTGMVGTHHRPSDDLSTYAFLTPANAMLSVELAHLAAILTQSGQTKTSKEAKEFAKLASEWSKRVGDAVWEHTVVNDIFAYETNGLGSRYVMDDANVPTLLSLPYLGFLDKSHPAYVATRKLLLSRGNPYYAAGKKFSGIGCVPLLRPSSTFASSTPTYLPPGRPTHGRMAPWPMSQITAIFGTDDDDEIVERLYLIARAEFRPMLTMNLRAEQNTAGLGLIHELQSIYSRTDYTRPWFAWANSYFAEMLLDLAQRKPGLIFKTNAPYVPGK